MVPPVRRARHGAPRIRARRPLTSVLAWKCLQGLSLDDSATPDPGCASEQMPWMSPEPGMHDEGVPVEFPVVPPRRTLPLPDADAVVAAWFDASPTGVDPPPGYRQQGSLWRCCCSVAAFWAWRAPAAASITTSVMAATDRALTFSTDHLKTARPLPRRLPLRHQSGSEPRNDHDPHHHRRCRCHPVALRLEPLSHGRTKPK
jgi:hypothetical protein